MAVQVQKKPSWDGELLDRLLAGRDPKTMLSADGLIGELQQALAERMLGAELDVHLEGDAEQAAGNHRNGYSPKAALTPEGGDDARHPPRPARAL